MATVSLLYYPPYQLECDYCSLVNTLNSNNGWVRLLTLPLALKGWSLEDSTPLIYYYIIYYLLYLIYYIGPTKRYHHKMCERASAEIRC